MLGLVGLLAGLAAGEAEREHVALGAPAPLPASHANVSRAIDKAVAAMNVRMAHYCPHQGAFASVELLGAALEVTSDAPLYTLGLRMDGQYNVTVFVRGREDVGKLVFVSSVPYCCSVRSANLANIARDVEKHNADPTRTYDQAVYKAFQGHTYASLARSRLGLLRRPDGSLFAGGGDEWAEPEPSDEGAPLKALEKGRSGSAGTEVEMAAYDFRVAHPACTPKVRDQGSCGSCWAQSSIGAFEDRLCAASGGTLNVKLSVQQQVSCNTLCLPRPDSDLCQGGCAGGFQDLSGAYLEQTGVVEAHVLPYTSGGSGSYEDHFGSTDGKGACPNNVLAQHRHFKARTGSTRQVSRVPSTLMAELSARGPLDVAMVVHNDFWNYKRGVYASGAASPAAGGHAVKMLGYGTDAASGLPYWICQNSWGTAWGEGGFFRAKRGDRIGLEQSAWMTMPIVPAIAVIPDALPPAVTPQAPPPPTPCTGRRCPRSPPPAGSTPSLYDAIVYTFKSFFGLQAAQPPTSGLILSGPRPAGANAAAAHGVQPAPHDRARLAISPEARRARKAAADGAHAERARARASDTAEPGGGEHERRRAHNIDASDARARGWHSGRHDGAAAARSGSADYSGQEEAGWSHVRHEASTVMRDPGAARRADAPDSALRHTRRSSARRSNDRREPDAADTRRADGEDEGDEPVRAHHTHHKEPSPVLSLPGAAAARAPDALGAGSTAVDGADVIGYLRLVSERDGSVAAEQPLTDVDGEVVVDKTALPVGSYAIVLCGVAADGGASERCDTEDDKVHVSRCPLRNGYACGGHGECVTLGSKEGKERGRCKCDDGYGGHECRPTCTSLPKLPSGCALRGGVWDSAEQAPTLDGGAGGALFTVRVHEDCELQLSTCHPFTNFDTHLSIFEGCPLQSAEASVGELPHPLAANDDACDLPDRAGASSISVPLSRGTYTVLVRGFDPHALGDFELSASGCGAPPLEQPPAAALPTSAHAHALFEKGARADRGAHETPDGAEPRAEPRGGRRSERASASATLDQVGEPREKGMRKGVAGATCPPRDTPSLGVGEPCEARAQKIVIGDVLTSMVTHTGGMLYRLTPQLPVTAEFSTCGSALDTEIKLYRGCPLSGGHLLALSDDDCGQGSFFVSSLEQGIDYFLVVNGYEGQVCPPAERRTRVPRARHARSLRAQCALPFPRLGHVLRAAPCRAAGPLRATRERGAAAVRRQFARDAAHTRPLARAVRRARPRARGARARALGRDVCAQLAPAAAQLARCALFAAAALACRCGGAHVRE